MLAFGVGAAIGLSIVLGADAPRADDSVTIASGNIDVSEAQRALDCCIDVEAGWMKVNYEIPDMLPICITEDYVDDNFALSVKSYGGYAPDLDRVQELYLNQIKTGKGGVLTITWDEGTPCVCPVSGCAGMIYTASFDIKDADVIMIDSNHLPSVCSSGVDCAWLCDGCPSPDLDKYVFVSVVTSWEGCHHEDQKFKLILAQIRYFQRPLTPNENFIAS
jgi:hypothetical protein